MRVLRTVAVVFTLGITCIASAKAQVLKDVPLFRSAPHGITVDRPDWAQFAPHSVPAAQKPDFYLRCMAAPDPVLSGFDQRAMCACMAANQARIDSAADATWYTTLGARAVTPYETFVTKVFAPCMYIEAQPVALDDCYRENHYRVEFETQHRFDEYCSCYAQQAERYMRAYAEPLIAARLAEGGNNDLDALSDPANLVLRDADYQIFMEARRQDCIKEFGVDNMQAR